ncbi:hypothetical protein I7X12_05850 [Halosimplex litoreum]|uniref:Uncharacterized protein n=1 Tax=Halosimplex litoreum TaxID=1198301 RepID=A0A7T3G0J5_9EURY|nr:hypothetical protein [Halosimplex litoreum]QPV64146.1 hypothetical protein I7X12_05850 [Halosimplex litoreum]
MYELGHGLGIGWLDDKGSGHIAECYSGSFCVGQFGVGGGNDETREEVVFPNSQNPDSVWSIMAPTGRPDSLDGDRFVFSIEELFTVDFEDIPSKND